MFYIAEISNGSVIVILEQNLEKTLKKYSNPGQYYEEGTYDLHGPYVEAEISARPLHIDGDEA